MGKSDLMTDRMIRQRKLDHIALAIEDSPKAAIDPGWSDVALTPVALPSVSPKNVDLTTEFLGARLRAPVMISAMTGGHQEVESINSALAGAAACHGVAMGVGSQRAGLLDKSLIPSYAIVRKQAPNAFLCGNIGISQIVAGQIGRDEANRLIEMIEADALAIHINVLQELVQPEGEIELARAYDAIAELIAISPVPVIVKETGCGIDGATAKRLAVLGAAAIDVGGAGGTSFTRIEGARAEQQSDERGRRIADTFASWGIPTACNLIEVEDIDIPVIATGGIGNGLDAAKALSLGARLAGIGRKILRSAMDGPDAASDELAMIIDEIKISFCLTDSDSIASFTRQQPVLTGNVAAWKAIIR